MDSRFLAIRLLSVASMRTWLASALLVTAGTTQAAQFVVNGPAGSGEFGRTVTTLPNGNVVVTDPGFDAPGPIADVGAVYLYRSNGTLISTLRGSSAGDRVGSRGIVVLSNGNFLVLSPNWDHGAAANAGAVTLGLGTSGIDGVVSATNSLVGSTADDFVGGSAIALDNGSFVVSSPGWNNGEAVDAGAVTFGSGTTGIIGAVSPANSLVGSTEGDFVGSGGVMRLGNGNYVVLSSGWDNGAVSNVGAVTFGSGINGISGAVSPTNSLIGSTMDDRVGSDGLDGTVKVLSNGNYVVSSTRWDNGSVTDAGAVTFGSATAGISGVVSPSNSLVGSTVNDLVGSNGITALSNGNYVVLSANWDNQGIVNAGAATFGSGSSGIAGVVSPTNSLVGSEAGEQVGINGATALSNGNYVVLNWRWFKRRGAATFGSGTTGVVGLISSTNSLVGATEEDAVGTRGVTALSNGNYVVCSPQWDNGDIIEAGAATFGSGTHGISGVVSPANSLVGSSEGDRVGENCATPLSNGNYVVRNYRWGGGRGAATFSSGINGVVGAISASNSLVGGSTGDQVGDGGVIALSNGNYVVQTPRWNNGISSSVGAVTFGSGTSGISGLISPANSLVGSNATLFSFRGVTALSNGNYVVRDSTWNNGASSSAGSVTFGSGTSGVSGLASPANSLIGSAAGDQIGHPDVTPLSNGNYVVQSRSWDNGTIVDAGAITLGLFNGSVIGPITDTHSVLGTVANQGFSQVFSYDPVRNQLAVGQPASNRVVLHRTGIATTISIVGQSPDPSFVGQAVTFTASVSATPNAPADGRVTFTTSSGQTCVDTTSTATSTTTADYSCTITFAAAGSSTVVAEYTGSIIHAFSGSGLETHMTLAPLFRDGFESP